MWHAKISYVEVSRADNKIIARTIVKRQTHNLKYYSISDVFFFLSGPSDEEETLTQNMFQIAQHTNLFYLLHDLFLERHQLVHLEKQRDVSPLALRAI